MRRYSARSLVWTSVLTAAVVALLPGGAPAARALSRMSHHGSQHLAAHTGASMLPPQAENRLLAPLRIMNYYPERDAWNQMWSQWNAAAVDADMARIASLHANTVRIIIQAYTFGYPVPSGTMQSRLAQMVALASKHGLRVQLTLFDWWSQYSDIAGSEEWAKAVVQPYASDPRIALVELKNEIDPSSPAAITWAQNLLPYLRSIDGGLPLTLSVSGSAGLSGLKALKQALVSNPPDYFDLHYYGSMSDAYAVFQQAQSAVQPAPLLIGESGYSTSTSNGPSGLPRNQTAEEAYQDQYYRTVESAARALGLTYASPWVLYDFPTGSLSWTTNPVEYDFGIFRVDTSAKPVALSLASIFSGNPVDTSFNNGFERSDGALPLNWRETHSSEAQFGADTTVAHSGHASARISQSTGDSSGVPSYMTTPISSVAAGHTYTLGAWVQGRNATGGTRLALAWFDLKGNYLGQNESPYLPSGTTSWQHLAVTATAPPGTASVQIHLKSGYNTGTVWFDDVTFGNALLTRSPVSAGGAR